MIISELPRFAKDLDGDREKEIRQANGEKFNVKDVSHLKKVQSRYMEPRKKTAEEVSQPPE